MNDHDLAELLHDAAEPVTRPDLSATVRRRAVSTRRRRGVLAIVSVGAVAAIVAVTGFSMGRLGPDEADNPPTTPVDARAWQPLPSPPLRPRAGALVAHIGNSIVVVGGYIPSDCPAGASCPGSRPIEGGAVFDLESQTWRPMGTTPRGIANGSQAGIDGHLLLVITDFHLWSYDLDRDTWTQLPDPPVELRGDDFLAVGGGMAYITNGIKPYQEARYERLNLSTGVWTRLPASKNEPILRLRQLFVTPDGLVVIGSTGDVNGRHTHGQAEILEHGHWTRLPDPHVLSYGLVWHWTGKRLVAPFLEDEDAGASLDVASRQWGRLPGQPSVYAGGWQLTSAVGDGSDLITDLGYTYDDKDQTWTTVPAPTAAAGKSDGSAAFAGRDLYALDDQGHFWMLPYPATDPAP